MGANTRGPNPWRRIGIAGKSHFVALLYNEPTKRLIACFNREVASGLSVGTLYHRRRFEHTYTTVFQPDLSVSYEFPVTPLKAPFLFFNAVRWRKSSKGWGGDWLSVSRLNLRSGKLSPVLTPSSLVPPRGYASGWVSSILEASEHGEMLLCKMGLERKVRARRTRVDYSLCRVDLGSGKIRIVAELPDAFL